MRTENKRYCMLLIFYKGALTVNNDDKKKPTSSSGGGYKPLHDMENTKPVKREETTREREERQRRERQEEWRRTPADDARSAAQREKVLETQGITQAELDRRVTNRIFLRPAISVKNTKIQKFNLDKELVNHEFDERAFLDLCINSSTNIRLNVIFNYDGEGGDPIRKINIDAIFGKKVEHIKNTAIDWGCSQDEVISIFGEPYGISEPVCGISAQNIIRIFLDTDVIGRIKVDTPFLGVDEFLSKIESRDPSKGYVSMITDNNMGHAYVVHIPPQKGNVSVNIYQSDLGDGVTRSVALSKWIEARGGELIHLESLINVIKNFKNRVSDTDLIASVFDWDSDMKAIRRNGISKQSGNDIKFSFDEYVPDNVNENVRILSSC